MIYAYMQDERLTSNDDALICGFGWDLKEAATFFQLDERVRVMNNLEFASQLSVLRGAPAQRQVASAA